MFCMNQYGAEPYARLCERTAGAIPPPTRYRKFGGPTISIGCLFKMVRDLFVIPAISQHIYLFLYGMLIFSIPMKSSAFHVGWGILFLLAVKQITINRPKFSPLFSQYIGAYLFLCLSMLVSSLLSNDPQKGLDVTTKFVFRYGGVLFLTYYFLILQKISAKAISKIILFTLGFLAVDGVYQYFSGVSIFGKAQVYQGIHSVVFNPNPYGLFMVFSAVLFCGAASSAHSRSHRRLFMTLFFISTISLLLSGSRGSWLSFVGALATQFFLNSRHFSKRFVILLALSLVVSVMVSCSLTDYVHARFALLKAGHSSMRILIWKGCIPTILENPVWGIGPGMYKTIRGAIPGMSSVHNVWISILLSLGIIGLVAQLNVMRVTGKAIVQHLSQHEVRIYFAPIFSAFIIGGMFDHSFLTSMLCLCSWSLFAALLFWHVSKTETSNS